MMDFDPLCPQAPKTWTCIGKMHVLKTSKSGKWKSIQPKAEVIICTIAEVWALLKLIKKRGIAKAQKCEPVYMLTKGQRVGIFL